MEIIQDDAKKLVQVWLSRKESGGRGSAKSAEAHVCPVEAAEIYGGGISLRAGGFEGEHHGPAGV